MMLHHNCPLSVCVVVVCVCVCLYVPKNSMMKFALFLVVYLQSPKKFFVGTYKVLDEIRTFSCSLPKKSQKFLC